MVEPKMTENGTGQIAFRFGHPIVTAKSPDEPIDWPMYLHLNGTIPIELHRGQCELCQKDMVSVMRYIEGRGYLIEYLCIGNRDGSCGHKEVL